MKLRLEVKLPRYGTSMEEGTIVEWFKQVGDEVIKGDILCQIETEKVAADFESPVAGRLTEIVVGAGSVAEVGSVLCRLEAEA
jgi:pyruvate/2-oxoglutarate dehydrogenase complex dihydrolipoamide acyltransferase (E2) component